MDLQIKAKYTFKEFLDAYKGLIEKSIFLVILILEGLKVIEISSIIYIYQYASIFLMIAGNLFALAVLLSREDSSFYKLSKETVSKKECKFSTNNLIIEEIEYYSYYLFLIAGYIGLINIPMKMLVLVTIMTVFPQVIDLFFGKRFFRKLHYVSSREYFILNCTLPREKQQVVNEYLALKDALTLECSYKENKKLFEDLAREYYKILTNQK